MASDDTITLFEAIKATYIRDGTIDPHAKEKLIIEMRKLDRNKVFVNKISDVFGRLENDDGTEVDENSEFSDRSGSRGGETKDVSKTKRKFEVETRIGTEGQSDVESSIEKITRRRRKNLQIAVEVFQMFTVRCIYSEVDE